jgi:hypothetical protein
MPESAEAGNATPPGHTKLQKMAVLTYAIYTAAVKCISPQGIYLFLMETHMKRTQKIVLALITANPPATASGCLVETDTFLSCCL